MSQAPAGASARAAAALALAKVRFQGVSLRAALPAVGEAVADPRDRALAEASVFAACRGLYRYEAVLRLLLQRPLERGDATIHCLLLCGLAQLDALAMSAHGVVDASVGAARLLRRPRHAPLVNAVLRRFLRERETLLATTQSADESRLNHPRWLIDALRAAWGDAAESAMSAGNQVPPLWLRVNRRRVDPDVYVGRLEAAGIACTRDPDLATALCLPTPPAATSLPGWDEGWISVQDGAAQRCVPALAARPGMRVLDACAAPGGKAAALLEAIDDLELLALDSDPERLARVGPALHRLGLHATLLAADAAQPTTWWDGRPFDRILVDAPCSATGILRRQPDIRWHRRAADVEALVTQQARLLDALWPLLAGNGRLVYVTCSILPDENARQIDAFLARHPDAHAVPLDARFGRPAGAGRQRLPGDDAMDGFFHAALERA